MGTLYDELRAALHAVWMRHWIVLAVAWAVCMAGWFVVSRIPNQYESRARVYVQLRQLLPADDGTVVVDQQKDLDRLRQTITSAVNLEKVVRGTDLARTVTTDRDVADQVATLQKAITLTAQQDNLFQISVMGRSSKLTAQIAQKLIEVFVNNNLSDNRDQTDQSLHFLDQQLAVRQKALQDADAKRADFQSRYLDALPGTGSLDDRIGAARQQLAQIETDLAAAQSGLNAVNAQMAGTPANVGGGGARTGPAHARVAAIEGQLADARAKGWTESHPDVIALKNQLAAAQTAARSEPAASGAPGSSNPLYFSLRSMQAERAAQVAALSQRRAQIQGDLAALGTKLSSAPGAAAEQDQIERDYQVLKAQYDKLFADRERVRIASLAQNAADAVKFSVIDPPTLPRTPATPNRPLLLTAVLIAGLGAGVAAAFAVARLRNTFDTVGRLEQASGMPVIGAIGEVMTATQMAMRRRQLRLFLGGTAGLGVAYLGLIGVEFVQRGMGA